MTLFCAIQSRRCLTMRPDGQSKLFYLTESAQFSRMNSAPIVISIIALVVSVAGLSFSIYLGLRDRPRIRARCCCFHPHPENPDGYPSFGLTITNSGRRPIVLRLLRGNYGTSYRGHFLEGGNVLLEENGIFELTLRMNDYQEIYGDLDDPKPVDNLWFEDTLGRRYEIKNVREQLKEFWALYRQREEERKRTPNHVEPS